VRAPDGKGGKGPQEQTADKHMKTGEPEIRNGGSVTCGLHCSPLLA
jgi:hypothetical protein